MNSQTIAALVVASTLLTACAPDDETDAAPGQLPVLAAPAEPTLEIGVMEGDPDYTFQDVVSTLHLPSGQLAVADAGSETISIFGADGTFVRRFGGKGEGPGEFRDLARLYHGGADSIMAGDGMPRLLMVFDSNGQYARQLGALDLSNDSAFALDSWMHGRYWIEGGLTEAERAPVRTALDALPTPGGSTGFRYVRVAEDGRLWILEPEPTETGARAWTIVDRSGRPVSVVDLPAAFDPQEIRADAVTGRWHGESDVNFVRSYAITTTGASRMAPTWMTTPLAGSSAPAPSGDEFLNTVRASIKRMAGAQEMYYATHYTYTTETDSLEWERPEGIEVHFVEGNSRAWTAVFSHPSFDRICALSYGFTVPAGWLPGMVLCSPERAQPAR